MVKNYWYFMNSLNLYHFLAIFSFAFTLTCSVLLFFVVVCSTNIARGNSNLLSFQFIKNFSVFKKIALNISICVPFVVIAILTSASFIRSPITAEQAKFLKTALVQSPVHARQPPLLILRMNSNIFMVSQADFYLIQKGLGLDYNYSSLFFSQ